MSRRNGENAPATNPDKTVVHRFDDSDNGEIVSKKQVGVKLSNKGSMLDALPKKPSREEFVKAAEVANEQLNQYATRAVDLSLKFKKALDDKTLPQNRSGFSADVERELLGHLAQLAVDMNTDPHETEGNGSVGLIALLLRSALIQRDKINQLEYNLLLLKNKSDAAGQKQPATIDTPK